MKKKVDRLQIPEGINELTAAEYQNYGKTNSKAVKEYPETVKEIIGSIDRKDMQCRGFTYQFSDTVRIKLSNVPEYFKIGKKKYYLTSNIYYGGVHWMVRKKVVEKCKELFDLTMKKDFLKTHIKTPIDIKFIYDYPKTKTGKYYRFDIDNKLSFWNKVFSDWLTKNGIIKDDSIEYIKEISYRYRVGECELTIIIINVVDRNDI